MISRCPSCGFPASDSESTCSTCGWDFVTNNRTHVSSEPPPLTVKPKPSEPPPAKVPPPTPAAKPPVEPTPPKEIVVKKEPVAKPPPPPPPQEDDFVPPEEEEDSVLEPEPPPPPVKPAPIPPAKKPAAPQEKKPAPTPEKKSASPPKPRPPSTAPPDIAQMPPNLLVFPPPPEDSPERKFIKPLVMIATALIGFSALRVFLRPILVAPQRSLPDMDIAVSTVTEAAPRDEDSDSPGDNARPVASFTAAPHFILNDPAYIPKPVEHKTAPTPRRRLPTGPPCVFEGIVFDLLTGNGVYAAKLEFFDSQGDVVARTETGAGGRYVVTLPGGHEFTLKVTHIDYTGRYIDEGSATSSLLEATPEERRILIKAASRGHLWVGNLKHPLHRDLALVPRVMNDDK